MHGFSALVLTVASRRRHDLARHRLERDDASFAAEGGKLAGALGKLARVGRAERLTTALETAGGDLSRALSVIHEAAQVAPPRLDVPADARLSEVQAALARSTGARSRPVLLEGRWWEGDSGPLLGFVMPDEVRAASGTKTPDDAAAAAAAAADDEAFGPTARSRCSPRAAATRSTTRWRARPAR